LLVLIGVLFWALYTRRFVLPRPRRRLRRRVTLSYRRRARPFPSCVRSRSHREKWRIRRSFCIQLKPPTPIVLKPSTPTADAVCCLRDDDDFCKLNIDNVSDFEVDDAVVEAAPKSWIYSFDPIKASCFLKKVNPLVHYHQLTAWNVGTGTTISYYENRVAVLYCSAPPPPFALSANHPNDRTSPSPQPCPDHEVPIVIDTGASWSVTPCIEDFVSNITDSFDKLRPLDGSMNVSGSGIVEWTIQDQDGRVKTIRNKALYVPSAGVRLFSPQTYLKETMVAAYFANQMA
jgi:hypothetical protein